MNHISIADLDYIEQMGSEEIKGLFAVNAKEIKKDVIENIKSADGDNLVRLIDEALRSGDFSPPTGLRDYIKSSRKRLRNNLSTDESAKLDAEILQLYDNGIFILSRGAIESYLPVGFSNKDLGRLIEFVSSEDFWDHLPAEGRAELEVILERVQPTHH